MVTTEERTSRLEGAYEQVDRRLGSLEDRMLEINQNMNARFEELNSRINTLIAVMIGASVTLAVGMIAGFTALFIALR